MMVDDFEPGRDASAPIDMLEHYFSAHGWNYERTGDEEIVAGCQTRKNSVSAPIEQRAAMMSTSHGP